MAEAATLQERTAFLDMMWPIVQSASQLTGLDPRLIMTQSILETGWGKSAQAKETNNYFGIKALPGYESKNWATNEDFGNGMVKVKDNFAVFSDPMQSAQEYAAMMKRNPAYQELMGVAQNGGGLQEQLMALGRSGYATDPNYFKLTSQIANNLAAPSATLPFTAPEAGYGAPGRGFAAYPPGIEGSSAGGPGFDNTFTPGLQQTTTAGLPFGSQSPAEPPERPQFENWLYNTPSEDSGKGTNPTPLRHGGEPRPQPLSLSDLIGAGTDPNDVGGLLPRDVDTTGTVSDPNDYTRRITDELLKSNMPTEYERLHSTQPSWVPEPGSEKGWERQPDPSMNFGLPDIGVNTPTTGPRYKYGTGMDFGLPDITNGAADNPIQNGAPAFLSYNEQYKQRTGQDYYNPYYEATKAQQTYADGAYDGSGRQVWGGYVQDNDGLWVQPTPGGQTHTLPDIVPNGIPTTGPNYKFGTGMDFGLPDLGNVGAEGKDSAGNPIWGGYVQNRTTGAWETPDWSVGSTGFGSAPTADANNPNTVGGTTAGPSYPYGQGMDFGLPDLGSTKLATPDWGIGDTGFGGGNIAPTSTFPQTNLSGSSPEPGGFGDFGMGSTTSAPINYATGNTGGTASLNLGGGTSPGFGSFGMGSTGTTGGFDPGDMGDAATTQGHTDYMNSARALDAFTAKQQADAVAQRNASDANIANAYAISNSYNPQYNLQNNFNNNVANLNNPLPSYSYSFL